MQAVNQHHDQTRLETEGDVTKPTLIWDVWRRYVNDKGCSAWIKTDHRVRAKTDRQAQSRIKVRFRNAHFTDMQMVAVPEDADPNKPEKITDLT